MAQSTASPMGLNSDENIFLSKGRVNPYIVAFSFLGTIGR